MKKMPAFIAAVVITALIGVAMLAIGINAFFNPNTVALADAPGASQPGSAQLDTSGDQLQQLQELVNQYQQRDQQYQQRLDEAAQRLNEANSQVQAYQKILIELQRRGVIQINQNGMVLIPSARTAQHDDGNFEFGD